MGVTAAGVVVQNTDNSKQNAYIETDATSIMMLVPNVEEGSGVQPQIGQFKAGADLDKLLEAITAYESHLVALAGLNPADVQKGGGDPRSGYAISISRSSLREVQRKYKPSFYQSDINTLEISAKMANTYLSQSLPESGYMIKYYNIPLSPEEQKGLIDDLERQTNLGYISPVDAVMILNPEYDRAKAIEHLRQVKSEQ